MPGRIIAKNKRPEKCILLLILLCTLSFSSFAQNQLAGKAVKIIDGDTFDLLDQHNIIYRIRLLDIDCPERRQDYYQLAKHALGGYIFGKNVLVIFIKKDRNGRILGSVYLNDVLINLQMVLEGYAWHFVKYSTNMKFVLAQDKAQKMKKGLWKGLKPIAPWDFRKIRRKIPL